VVEVRFRINADFSEVATDIEGFKSDFKKDVAQASGVSEDRIVIDSVAKGSVIVNFFIKEGTASDDVSSSVASTLFKEKISTGTVDWSPSLTNVMADGAELEAMATRTMSSESLEALTSTSGMTVMLTPLDGWSPPLGCSCVLAPGITDGCAEHKSVSPPWCLADANCPDAEAGSWGEFVWCLDPSEVAASAGLDLDHGGLIPSMSAGPHYQVNVISIFALLPAFIWSFGF